MQPARKTKHIDTPAVLTPFAATLKVDRVWSTSIPDKGAKVLRLGLGLASEGNRIYAAGYKGEVIAFERDSGRVVWTHEDEGSDLRRPLGESLIWSSSARVSAR